MWIKYYYIWYWLIYSVVLDIDSFSNKTNVNIPDISSNVQLSNVEDKVMVVCLNPGSCNNVLLSSDGTVDLSDIIITGCNDNDNINNAKDICEGLVFESNLSRKLSNWNIKTTNIVTKL